MYDVEKLPTAYVKALRVTVEERSKDWIILDQSPFAPELPERMSDTGTIGTAAVEQVVTGGGDVLMHRIAEDDSHEPLKAGAVVTAAIDWDRRFAMMRLHSALHLAYLGFETIHGPAVRHDREVTPDHAFVDVTPSRDLGGTVNTDTVNTEAISTWIERVVADNLMIAILSPLGEPNRRYWYVDGVGTVACSSLHPQTTGEVGGVHFDASECRNNVVRLTVRLKLR